jgi:signal transduction histidine kinase
MMPEPHPQEAALWKKLETAHEPTARCLALRALADHVGRYDLARSLALAEEGIKVAGLSNLAYEGALCRLERARSLRLLGQYAEAKAALEGLCPIFLDAGDKSSAGLAVKTKAATYLDLGELQEALDANEEALALFDACGDQMNYCSAVMDSAFIFNERGQFSDALSILQSVETRLNSLSAADAEYQWLVLDAARAQNLLALENVEEAATAADRALARAEQIGNRNIAASCQGIIAVCSVRLGNTDRFDAAIAAFRALSPLADDPYDLTVGSINCGRAMMSRGDVETAEEWLTRALAQAESSGIKKLAGECHKELVHLLKQKGEPARALYHFEQYHRIDTDLRRTDLTRRVARMEMQIKVEQVRMETVERSRQELERLVERRTRELQEAKNHAELANRSKSDFLAHMTHELRTPLNAIIGFAELIMLQLKGSGSSPKHANYLADIHSSGKLLLSTINDILDISKIEAGKRDLDLEIYEADKLIEECASLVAGRARDADVALEFSVIGTVQPLQVDLLAAKQILLNLLTNAVKYTPCGGRVQVKAFAAGGDMVCIEVKDTGIGMSAENIAQAIKPFGQVANAFNKKQVGTGLGLPIARSLTELHGGRFVIESKLGQGTCISVMLPVAPVRTLRVVGGTRAG